MRTATAAPLEIDLSEPLIPDDEEWPRLTVDMPASIWERLRAVVRIENKKREGTAKRKLSLGDVMAYLLRPGLEAYEAANAEHVKEDARAEKKKAR
jgi:hypothetical protein